MAQVLGDKRKMPFEAENLIKQAIDRHDKNIAVACSFGKDSMAVLEMCLKVEPNIKVIFENTGVEFPETIIYKNIMKKEWGINLYETKPIGSFWSCAKSNGLPTTRKTGGKGSNSPKCCNDLKEEPALNLMKKLKVNSIFTGLQACESRSRDLLGKRYDNKKAVYMEKKYDGEIIEFCSQRWYAKKEGVWKYHPIMLWDTKKVWEGTLKRKVPINRVYTKWDIHGNIHTNPVLKISHYKDGRLLLDGVPSLYPRCGCLPCTAYISWGERLSKSHPILYNQLKKLQDPNQKELKCY